MATWSSALSAAAMTWVGAAACAPAHARETALPPVPPVASIPVAPIATRELPAPAFPPAAPASQADFPLAALAAAPGPLSIAELPAARALLVDELPFRPVRKRVENPPSSTDPHRELPRGKRGRRGRAFHPAPGIVVDLLDSPPEAIVPAIDLQRTLRSAGYWPFRSCYEEGLRRDQHLTGKVSLDLLLAPTTVAVEDATVTRSTVRDESVSLCIAREASHLPLQSTAKGDALGLVGARDDAGAPSTHAKVDVTLSTGDGPVPLPPAVRHADELRAALRTAWPVIEQCYEAGQAKHPGIGGRLELLFRAKSNGEIADVLEGETRFPDVDVTRCALGVYRASKLPAFVDGPRHVTFVYAIHFETR